MKLFCIEHMCFTGNQRISKTANKHGDDTICKCCVNKIKDPPNRNRIYFHKYEKTPKIIRSFEVLESEAYRINSFCELNVPPDQFSPEMVNSYNIKNRTDDYVMLNPNTIVKLMDQLYKYNKHFFPDERIPKTVPKF